MTITIYFQTASFVRGKNHSHFYFLHNFYFLYNHKTDTDSTKAFYDIGIKQGMKFISLHLRNTFVGKCRTGLVKQQKLDL